MGALVGVRGQRFTDHLFDASGTIATGGTAQLLMPVGLVRSSLIIENISDTNMFLEFGAARATATLTSGAVSSLSITNAGIGYSRPPSVVFLGGALGQNSPTPTYAIAGSADYPSPNNPNATNVARPAQAHCVMTGSAPNQTVSSIVVDDGGAGYLFPPYVLLVNDPLDPFGCAVPSATSGILLLANGGSYTSNGSVCTTDQIAIFCATISKAFTCKYSL